MTSEAEIEQTSVSTIKVQSFSTDLTSLFRQPKGVVEYGWPPIQIQYLGEYLGQLGCRSIVVESHYIDRDYIDDVALFYSRSLRGYPNFCQRMHFFAAELNDEGIRNMLREAARDHPSGLSRIESELQRSYLGYSVIRPLPGSPIGRTVLKTFGPESKEGFQRNFSATRKYRVHLCGLALEVTGLAFQQQDRGVSACATTALWCALHKVAPMEELRLVTPAEITEAASRYFLPGGRALPSEGLTVEQLCEATRAAGLAPLHVRATSYLGDRAQLLTYLSSGFAPVLAIKTPGGEGHAICAVGYKLGTVDPQGEADLVYRDGATALKGLYVHDDRLGPYASADLLARTQPDGKKIKTELRIRWPQQPVEFEQSLLVSLIVPVPSKLRLSAYRMRELGLGVAQWTGTVIPGVAREVVLNCRFQKGTTYKRLAYSFGLTDEGAYALVSELNLSRYVGVIELLHGDRPLFDVLLDSTETTANPAVLACVRRSAMPDASKNQFNKMAEILGGRPIW